jgi:subtilisin-like proprotein convertase family protein
MSTKLRAVLALPAGVIVAVLAGLVLAAAPAPAATQSFANRGPITMAEADVKASPYPSSVPVAGMTGPVTDVNVTLHLVGDNDPAGVAVLLVSPSGKHVQLMYGNCGTTTPIEDFTWIFDQQASGVMGSGPCDQFVYRPSPVIPNHHMPAPAPPEPHGVSLDAFNGDQANGTWSLYVSDPDFASGDIEGGWTLTLTTGPADVVIPQTGTVGAAGPYPATRTVSGMTGVITDVDVILNGVWHERPDDLDLLLVGPQGQKVVLMSDACGVVPVVASGFGWNDEAPTPMSDANVCAPGFHRPTDFEPGDSWLAPAPPGPYAGALAAFDLTDPNGDWRLFVADDASDAVGFFTNRFQLGIETRPKATVAFTESAVRVREGERRALTLTRSGPAALGAGVVTVTSAPASATSGTDFRPVSTVIEFAAGERTKTVDVEALADAQPEPDEVFVVAMGSPTGDAATSAPSSVAVTIPAPGGGGPGGGGAGPGGGGAGPGGGGPGGTDTAARPTITRLHLTPSTFRAAGRGASGARKRIRTGSRVTYRLSTPATVTFTVERRSSGRRAGARCVRPTRANHRRRACVRYVAVRGSLTRGSTAGANRFSFTGRLRNRRLKPGSYRLIAKPPAGRAGGPSVRAMFRIVR